VGTISSSAARGQRACLLSLAIAQLALLGCTPIPPCFVGAIEVELLERVPLDEARDCPEDIWPGEPTFVLKSEGQAIIGSVCNPQLSSYEELPVGTAIGSGGVGASGFSGEFHDVTRTNSLYFSVDGCDVQMSTVIHIKQEFTTLEDAINNGDADSIVLRFAYRGRGDCSAIVPRTTCTNVYKVNVKKVE